MTNASPISQRLSRVMDRALRSKLAAQLTYPHDVDAYAQAIRPTWAKSEVRARIVNIRQQTNDTVTVQLKPNRNWKGFQPGQYLRLSIDIDGKKHTRCFSPANSAASSDSLLELTCKIGPESIVSKHLQRHSRAGDVISLSQAEGEFALPQERPENVLLISGGSGITPVMSMLRTLCDEGFTGSISFLHYCNRQQDQLYANELEELAQHHSNIRLLRCYAEKAQHGELEGLFQAQHLQQHVPDYANRQTFLCGPPGLMQAISAHYESAELQNQLHLEHFSAAISAPADANSEGELRLARSERLLENNGQTLLDQAEAAGLKPLAGCRMGICYSCTCKKTSGQVRDLRTGKLSSHAEEDIQICVSVPVGTVEIDL